MNVYQDIGKDSILDRGLSKELKQMVLDIFGLFQVSFGHPFGCHCAGLHAGNCRPCPKTPSRSVSGQDSHYF